MAQDQKRIFSALLVICAIYFILFIPPNQVGAKDANMLAVFEVDEYSFYPHITNMLEAGETAYQTLRNFLIYIQYTYGYPFYFFSALSLLPVRLIFSSSWLQMTTLNILILRQIISVLPMLCAVVLLVYLRTRFHSLWRSLLLLLILLIIPGLFGNNMFWHPDSLSVLSIILTFFFLDRDNLRFEKNYFVAAAACGLATSVKNQGLFFFLVIPLYLGWGLAYKKINWKRVLVLAVVFISIMVAAVIVSNPLLLLPIERTGIINVQLRNIQQLAQGFMVKTTSAYFSLTEYPTDFRIHYGELGFVLLTIVSMIIGVIRPQQRLLNTLVLAFVIPLFISLNFTGTRRTHYFLPVMLPLISGLINLAPELPEPDIFSNRVSHFNDLVKQIFQYLLSLVHSSANAFQSARIQQKTLALLVTAFLLFQVAVFTRKDFEIYRTHLNRETESKSIAFFNKLDEVLFSKFPVDAPLHIYRDWHIYVPPRQHWLIEMTWDLSTYDLINDLKPDVILLEQENIRLFNEAGIIQKASDPDKMQKWQSFYGDASQGQVPGYQIYYQDSFAIALIRNSLIQEK